MLCIFGNNNKSISTYIQTATKDTKVIEALNRLVNERVAALPIVDEDGRLINIFSKFDVFNLESFADLETSLEEVTKLRMFFDGVYTCKGKKQTITFDSFQSSVGPSFYSNY